MRAGGTLEVRVVAEWCETVRRANAVQVSQESRFGACQPGCGGGGGEDENENRRAECREPLQHAGDDRRSSGSPRRLRKTDCDQHDSSSQKLYCVQRLLEPEPSD